MKKGQPQKLGRTALLLLLRGVRRSATTTTQLLQRWEGHVSERVDGYARQQSALREQLYRLSHRLDGVMDAVESVLEPRRPE